MKKMKIKKMLMVFSAAFILGVSALPFNASAAGWTSWEDNPMGNGCKTRVWHDADTYTTNATTIDFKVEQNGKCGKLYYKSSINTYGNAPAYWKRISPYQTGSFSNITPLKQIKLSSLTQTGVKAKVLVELYKNAGMTSYVSDINSTTITINKR
ncbi:hypothetical protein H7T43_24050 [Peribacillus simplex]|uniref:hypothetical protein n=1 Tax=Peribacillus simplex TaxID=1478 RepID=UPI002989EB22|nr:hypothetical protein [Peribacillus simplex]MBX9957936.1 hypothetical protein [Peribacillus simplex]